MFDEMSERHKNVLHYTAAVKSWVWNGSVCVCVLGSCCPLHNHLQPTTLGLMALADWLLYNSDATNSCNIDHYISNQKGSNTGTQFSYEQIFYAFSIHSLSWNYTEIMSKKFKTYDFLQYAFSILFLTLVLPHNLGMERTDHQNGPPHVLLYPSYS